MSCTTHHTQNITAVTLCNLVGVSHEQRERDERILLFAKLRIRAIHPELHLLIYQSLGSRLWQSRLHSNPIHFTNRAFIRASIASVAGDASAVCTSAGSTRHCSERGDAIQQGAATIIIRVRVHSVQMQRTQDCLTVVKISHTDCNQGEIRCRL